MYKVKYNEFDSAEECATLADAMAFAKSIGIFVTIYGPDFEVCGRFGVDSVRDGKCPDGVEYDWNKASRIGAPKRVKA